MTLQDDINNIYKLDEKIAQEGEWKCIWKNNKPYGIRNKGGFLLFLTHPNRYDGQEERYKKESIETHATSEFIAAAPLMVSVIRRLEAENKKLQEIIDIDNFIDDCLSEI